jgi:hypothetical protein
LGSLRNSSRDSYSDWRIGRSNLISFMGIFYHEVLVPEKANEWRLRVKRYCDERYGDFVGRDAGVV